MADFADQELAEFIAQFNALHRPPPGTVPVEEMRAQSTERAAAKPRGPAMHSVTDLLVGGHLPVRLYRPTGDALPLLVWLHGGGWVIGDLDTHDRPCRLLAEQALVAVLAVDYRLAPEHPWPAAVDDAVTALQWVAAEPAELEPQPPTVGVGGDSAGGLTAALACVRMRTEAPESLPALQVLVYANTDLTESGGSMQEKGHGFGLEAEEIAWFSAQWVPDKTMLGDPRVSVLHEPRLTGLPSAVVVTCEHDPLRDQGEAYASRLEQAGLPVVVRREPGMVHNFMLWDLVSPACAAAIERVASDVSRGLRLHG
jgi:acetyl esterase/lipase